MPVSVYCRKRFGERVNEKKPVPLVSARIYVFGNPWRSLVCAINPGLPPRHKRGNPPGYGLAKTAHIGNILFRNSVTAATIHEVVRNRLKAYCKAPREGKEKILDTLEAILPIIRRAIISRMQKQNPWKHSLRKREAKTRYGPGRTAAFRTVWEVSGEICGELLHPIIAEYVSALHRDGHWTHRNNDTKLLYAISEGTVKRRVSEGKEGMWTLFDESVTAQGDHSRLHRTMREEAVGY